MAGKDYHEVVHRLGQPGETLDMPYGKKTLILNRRFRDAKPRFETNLSGIVVGWSLCEAEPALKATATLETYAGG